MIVFVKVHALLIEMGASMHLRPFSPAALACLPVLEPHTKWTAEIGGGVGTRRDLRGSHLICSVDPPGCQVR